VKLAVVMVEGRVSFEGMTGQVFKWRFVYGKENKGIFNAQNVRLNFLIKLGMIL
jgi:hypothetical protein